MFCSFYYISLLTSNDTQNPYKCPFCQVFHQVCIHYSHKLQEYYKIACLRSAVNQPWIPKNSKKLLEDLKSSSFNHLADIKSLNSKPFIQPFLIRTRKEVSKVLFGIPSFSKTVTPATNICYWGTKKHIL